MPPKTVAGVVAVILGTIGLSLLGVIDIDAADWFGRIDLHQCCGHPTCCAQIQLQCWGLRKLKSTFQILIKPELRRDFIFGGVLMIMMRCASNAPIGAADFFDCGGQVVDPPVKIIRGRKE